MEVMGEDPDGDEKLMVAVGRTKVVKRVVLVRRILTSVLWIRKRLTSRIQTFY
jgi:hypothetical protein